jgi:hypothetical protein
VDVDDADDTTLWDKSVDIQSDILDKLRRQAPDAIHFVILDACRNELHLRVQGRRALEPDLKSFAPVPQIENELVAFSTSPGRTASDKGVGSGAYAIVFSEEVVRPGIEAVTMFRNVHARVLQSVGQSPWLSLPTFPQIYLAGQSVTAQDQPRTLSPREAFELERESTKRTITPLFTQLADEGVLPGGVFDMERKWPSRSIKVCFLDGNVDVNKPVASIARQWTLYGNIDFDFGDWDVPRQCSSDNESSDVRVSYNETGNWSYVGVESKADNRSHSATLNLESLKDKSAEGIATGRYNGAILHEFGHALGFLHTWSLPSANCDSEIDWPKAYAIFGQKYGWSQEMVQDIFRPLSPGTIVVGAFDKRSVMSYELPEEIFFKRKESRCFTTPSQELSLRDKLAMFTVYK